MNVENFLNQPNENYTFHSSISSNLKELPCIMGIDEAGRGPVLGPMVYGACFCPISSEKELANLGCDDSKVLKEEHRNTLFSAINESNSFMGWIITILSPNFLSTSMLSRTKYNLNSISHDTAINLIKSALKMEINVQKVFVDTVGPPQSYQEKLQKIFPRLNITVEKKADSKFPIVSAASICAKVCRDKVISEWKFEENFFIDKDYGSGYTSDPVTKAWLHKNVDRIFGFPSFVRFSWSTAEKILEEEAVPVQWPDDENKEGDLKSSTPAITTFFSGQKKTIMRHKFFTSNKLYHVESL